MRALGCAASNVIALLHQVTLELTRRKLLEELWFVQLQPRILGTQRAFGNQLNSSLSANKLTTEQLFV